ncbi:MAG: hypothetical protein Q8P56_01535 [Candidatus Uhrbacteria bacterium]|nr:hypothetical protein [Candidatus Uhrbacteria bacterium]
MKKRLVEKKEEHGFIRWLIKIFCPGFHLAKNPAKRKKEEKEDIYQGEVKP